MLFVRSQFLAALALALSINVANGQSEGAGHPEIIPHKINPHEADASPTAGSTGQITPSIVYTTANRLIMSCPRRVMMS